MSLQEQSRWGAAHSNVGSDVLIEHLRAVSYSLSMRTESTWRRSLPITVRACSSAVTSALLLAATQSITCLHVGTSSCRCHGTKKYAHCISCSIPALMSCVMLVTAGVASEQE